MASYLDCKTTMHKKLFLFSFLLIPFFYADAQQSPVADGIKDSSFIINNEEDETDVDDENSGFAKDVKGDTSINFSEVEINRDSIILWKNKKEYGWIRNLDSFLIDRKKQAEKQPKVSIQENKGSSFLDKFFNSGILQTLLWMVAVSLVVFIIYKLFLSNGIFGKRSKKAPVQIETDEEDITLENDYDTLLRKAYTAGNIRMAMRYLFLKTLQRLNDKEMIRYAIDKTNSNYAREMPPAKRNAFASLALYYEYVWYGNAAITSETFDAIEIRFNEFLNRI